MWRKAVAVLWRMVKRLLVRLARRFRKERSSLLRITDLERFADRIVSDTILFNEIPSPTDQEELRAAFIKHRLAEFGIETYSVDKFGNIILEFPGTRRSEDCLLLYTDMDNLKYSATKSIVEIKDRKLIGLGVGDNSMGVAALLVLCECIKKNNIALNHNLLVLFSLRNTPENDFQGVRHFISVWRNPISTAVYLFGMKSGRLVRDSLGISNLSISLESKQDGELGRSYTDSAVDLAAELYNEIKKINWSEHGVTINIVRMDCGVGFKYFPAAGNIDVEVFSRDQRALVLANERIAELVRGLTEKKTATLKRRAVSFVPPANDGLNAELNEIVQKVHQRLGIKTHFSNVPEYVSILNQFNIPTATLGISKGVKAPDHEHVEVGGVLTGFRQVLQVLAALDERTNKGDADGK